LPRTSRTWRVIGAAFLLLNIAGAGYALAMGEPTHALTHALIVVAVYSVWGLGSWQARRRDERPPEQLSDHRLDYLQQSVDAVALEVERIGEAQRYADKLRAQRGETSPTKKEE
jgi:hypothetical protein